jgi:hypothetical protein
MKQFLFIVFLHETGQGDAPAVVASAAIHAYKL